jgi:bla regulator protein BlaR1
MPILRWVGVAFASFLVLGGCGMLPPPGDTIKPPTVLDDKEHEDELRIDIQKRLPAGARLLAAANPEGSQAIQFRDLDGDGIDEALVVYEQTAQSQKSLSAALLKEQNKQWKLIWTTRGLGHAVDYAGFADVTGDGHPEVLLGWVMGADAGKGLDIYQWRNGSLELLTNIAYHINLDVEQMPSTKGENKQAEIAIWKKDVGSAYQVEVYRWDPSRQEMIPAEDVYPGYFRKVVAYYEEQTINHPDQAIYWYYLADAQRKTYQSKEALKSIEKGLALQAGYPSKEQFERLKEQVRRTVSYMASHMTIGRTQKEIENLFGTDHAEVPNAKEGGKLWRYDYPAKEGYSFDDGGMDAVDVDGLQNGLMFMQLFISWSDQGTADGYTLYYLDQEGNIQEERIFSDGGLKTSTSHP